MQVNLKQEGVNKVHKLSNKTIIITGANGGIGSACAKLFHSQGAKLILTDKVSKEEFKLNKLSNAEYIKANISNEKDIDKVFKAAKNNFKKLDGFLHCAGIESTKGFLDTSIEHFDKVININLRASFLFAKKAALMMKDSGGSIVLIASQKGLAGSLNSLSYNTSKGGIIIMGKSMALELGKYNIRVNNLCPGAIDTPMLRRDINSQSHPEKILEEIISEYPLGRIGNKEEIAKGALYLISDDSKFVTGTNLVIDGGNTAGVYS